MQFSWKTVLVWTTLLASLSTACVNAQAQTPSSPAPRGATAATTITAKVTAIDSKNRVVTLQDAQGNTFDVKAGPGVTRFNQIKVGDTVTFTYQESVALAIVKPGAVAPPAAQSTPTVTRNAGNKPSGTISQTQTATVTIQAIDMQTPSVTVKTQDGRVLTLSVQDKNNLAGLKVGDVVQITYSQALMVNVQ
jgi:Cu/Ag efflux protein CusF